MTSRSAVVCRPFRFSWLCPTGRLPYWALEEVDVGCAVVLFRGVSIPCNAFWPEQSQHQQASFNPTHLQQSGLLSSELAIPFEDNHQMEWMPLYSAQTALLLPRSSLSSASGCLASQTALADGPEAPQPLCR